MIAFCRLRNDLREFRLDRILSLITTTDVFANRDFSFDNYFLKNTEKKLRPTDIPLSFPQFIFVQILNVVNMKTLNIITAFFLYSAILFTSCNNLSKQSNINEGKGQIIEFAPIVLKDSVSEEMLLKSSEILQRDFLMKQSGFIKRTLVRKSTGEYIDIVVWDSETSANNAANNSLHSRACSNYFQCMINTNESDVAHYTVIKEYTR